MKRPWVKPGDIPKKGEVVCKIHGNQPPRVICGKCAVELVEQNQALGAQLAGVPEVLRKAANDIDVRDQQIKLFDQLLEKVYEATHKQYCVDGLHGARKEGDHHPACEFLFREMEVIENVGVQLPSTAEEVHVRSGDGGGDDVRLTSVRGGMQTLERGDPRVAEPSKRSDDGSVHASGSGETEIASGAERALGAHPVLQEGYGQTHDDAEIGPDD